MIQINYRDTRPFYQQIKDNVRHLVVSGALKKDDKLPSVRELAASLAINPNTIQRAYRELENEGYIYTLPGKGTFAAEMDHTNQDGAAVRAVNAGQVPDQGGFAGTVWTDETVDRSFWNVQAHVI